MTLGEVFIKKLDEMKSKKQITKEEYSRFKKAYLELIKEDKSS
jgi:hypothetical protein